jgi:hypothetical protein
MPARENTVKSGSPKAVESLLKADVLEPGITIYTNLSFHMHISSLSEHNSYGIIIALIAQKIKPFFEVYHTKREKFQNLIFFTKKFKKGLTFFLFSAIIYSAPQSATEYAA